MKQTFDARLVNDSLPPNHHIVVTTAQIKGGVTNHNHRHIVLHTIYFVLDGNSVVCKRIRVHVPHIFFVLVAINTAAVAVVVVVVVVVVAVALVAAHVGVIAVALVAAHIGVCIFRESQVGEFQYCQDYMFVLSNRTC
jgi:hypothetical protein